MVIWYFYGNFGIFPPKFVVPRQIWQPCRFFGSFLILNRSHRWRQQLQRDESQTVRNDICVWKGKPKKRFTDEGINVMISIFGVFRSIFGEKHFS
jgi:hypothetical protein